MLGALKMRYPTMHDLTLKDQIAGVEMQDLIMADQICRA